LVTAGFTNRNFPLQPWHYLSEVAKGLSDQGHSVSVISNVPSDLSGWDAPAEVRYVKNVTAPLWQSNTALIEAMRASKPEVVLWHVGLTTFLYQTFPIPTEVSAVGIFTSPIHTVSDLRRAGLGKLFKNPSHSAVHILSALTPNGLLRRRMRSSSLNHLVVQTNTLCKQLQDNQLWQGKIRIISPGIDPIWSQSSKNVTSVRQDIGCSEMNKLIIFFGSPAPLRGLPTLLRAFQMARKEDQSLELLVLCRHRAGELDRAAKNLNALVQSNPERTHIRVMDGFLPREKVAEFLSACDVVALPFELVPSDAPLSLLEAAAAGKPVVTSRLGCLPELIPPGQRYLAEPADAVSLAENLLKSVQDSPSDNLVKQAARNCQQVGLEWSDYIQNLA
jgi:glycosyltransferase involved in cell wall biosynthesis